MIIRNSEFLKSTSCPENSRGVSDNSLGICNLLLVLVLGSVCGVLVSLAAGEIGHDKVDFTHASYHNVPMRGHRR